MGNFSSKIPTYFIINILALRRIDGTNGIQGLITYDMYFYIIEISHIYTV